MISQDNERSLSKVSGDFSAFAQISRQLMESGTLPELEVLAPICAVGRTSVTEIGRPVHCCRLKRRSNGQMRK
jgi:hypothetical protein